MKFFGAVLTFAVIITVTAVEFPAGIHISKLRRDETGGVRIPIQVCGGILAQLETERTLAIHETRKISRKTGVFR